MTTSQLTLHGLPIDTLFLLAIIHVHVLYWGLRVGSDGPETGV